MKTKSKKALLSLVSMFVLMLSISFTAHAAEEQEPNDKSNMATVVETGILNSGQLNVNTDVDWYKFTTTQDYFKFQFVVDPSKVNFDDIGYGWNVTIYNSTGTSVIKQYKNVTTSFETPVIPETGSFFVKIQAYEEYHSYSPIGCIYDFKINETTDPLWESEDNDASSTANTISLSKTYKGALQYGDDVDWYLVDATTGAFNVSLTLDSDTAVDDIGYGWKVSLFRYGNSQALVTYSGITEGVTSFDIPYKEKFLIKVSAEEDYYSYAPIDCTYNLKVIPHKSSELWEKELNETTENATKLSTGKLYSGNLDNVYDVDYFKYTAPCYGVLKLDFSRDLADDIGYGWEVAVLDSDGTIIYSDKIDNGLSLEKSNISVKKGTTYYVKVNPVLSYGGYSPVYINYKVGVTFTAKTDNVQNLKATQTTNSITLKWNKVAGANGYKVYKYNSSTKKYTAIKTTTSNSYTIKDLKAGTAYKYYVKAYQTYKDNPVYSGKYTKIATATEPSTPKKLKAASKTTTSINLTWNKVTGASGYRVYKYNKSDQEWVTYKSVTEPKLAIKSLKAGTTYKFKVKAYKTVDDKKIYSEASSILTTATKPSKVKLSSLSSKKGNFTAAWGKITSSSGYVVEYSTSKTFSSKKTVTVSDKTTTSRTVKNLKSGKTYYVRVRAFKTVGSVKVYGAYSSVKSIKIK